MARARPGTARRASPRTARSPPGGTGSPCTRRASGRRDSRRAGRLPSAGLLGFAGVEDFEAVLPVDAVGEGEDVHAVPGPHAAGVLRETGQPVGLPEAGVGRARLELQPPRT